MGPRARGSNVLDAACRRNRRTPGGVLRTIIALVLAGAVAPAQAGAQRALPASSGQANQTTALAFTGVTVIDVTDGRRLPGQTVVIVGHRVHAVGPAHAVQVPPDAQVVDARGKYLIPGLWDMHAHIDDHVEWYPSFIAYGVTGVREMAQRFYDPITTIDNDKREMQRPFLDGRASGVDTFRLWQSQVLAGTRVGPRAVGPSADLDGAGKFLASKPEDLPRVLDSLKAAGMVFLKYHNGISEPAYFFAAAREARRVGLPLVGHISEQISTVEAADSGLRSIEHVAENRQCWAGLAAMEDSTPQTPADSVAREQPCALAAAAYLRNGTWLTPTLLVYYRGPMNLQWESVSANNPVWSSDSKRRVAIAQRFIRTMRRFGVRTFLAGSDLNDFRSSRESNGLALPQEVVLLAHAGLTPLEALQAATLHPAQFFHATDSLGTVAPGKLADLVLLDADPLVDSRNVLKTRAVVANGRYFDRTTLDTLAPDAPQLIQSFLERLDAAPAKLRGVPATAPSSAP